MKPEGLQDAIDFARSTGDSAHAIIVVKEAERGNSKVHCDSDSDFTPQNGVIIVREANKEIYSKVLHEDTIQNVAISKQGHPITREESLNDLKGTNGTVDDSISVSSHEEGTDLAATSGDYINVNEADSPQDLLNKVDENSSAELAEDESGKNGHEDSDDVLKNDDTNINAQDTDSVLTKDKNDNNEVVYNDSPNTVAEPKVQPTVIVVKENANSRRITESNVCLEGSSNFGSQNIIDQKNDLSKDKLGNQSNLTNNIENIPQPIVITVKEAKDSDRYDLTTDSSTTKVECDTAVPVKEDPVSTQEPATLAPQPNTKEKKKGRWSAFKRKSKSRNSEISDISKDAERSKSTPTHKSKTAETNSENTEVRHSTIKVSTFHRFINYISKKFRIERKAKNQKNLKSMRNVIGITTTGAALVLINEVEESGDNKTTGTQEEPAVNEFELLDCATDSASMSICKETSKMSSSTTDFSNERFKIPSPVFNPLKVVYDSVDDVVEGLFQHMIGQDNFINSSTSKTSIEAARPTPANIDRL